MKQALQAAATLTGTDLRATTRIVRMHPLFEDEIHIDEELINLEESFNEHKISYETLKEYPSQNLHVINEQKLILQHCFGLIVRMIQGKPLPRPYRNHDIAVAVMKLSRLLVDRALREGRVIDDSLLQPLKPFLSMQQRIKLRRASAFPTPHLIYLLLIRRISVFRSAD